MRKEPINLLVFVTSTLLVLACLLAGCGNGPGAATADTTPTATPPPTATLPPTATPLPRGGNLTIAQPDDIPHLQPWRPRSRSEEQVVKLLYSGLVRLDDKLRPLPDLAERWQPSPDGRTITFTLRSNLVWHDGEPLDSVDVHFTLDRMRALPFTTTALLSDLHNIAGIATPDKQTIVLSLTERHAPLLSSLTLPILPRHLLEDEELGTFDFWDMPIGSGPFQFERRDPGQSIVLTRNNAFYRGAPLLDRVVFVGAADPTLRMEALRDERLLLSELTWNATRTYTGELDTLRIEGYPENGFYFLAFNLREGRPFADLRVRQARARALDLPLLVESVTKGQGIPIASSAAPGSWADLTPLPNAAPDLDDARARLNEAGWSLPPGATIRQREGITFTARLLVRNDDMRRIAAANRIAEAGAAIGLDINVEPADFSTVIVSKYAPPYDFDLLLGSWINGAGDPDMADYAYYDPDDFPLFHSSQINQGEIDTRVTRNMVGYRDSVYDAQALAGRQLYDIEARIDAYRTAQERISKTLPYLYLWADRIPVALNRRVTTLEGPVNLFSPAYLWNIERWYLTDYAR